MTYTRFPGVPLQPLEHLSIGIERCLHVTIHIFGYKNIFFFEHYHTILQKVLSKVEFFDYLHIVSALYSRKNALYIVIGDIFHLLNGYIIYICKFAGNLNYVGGLVSLSSVRNRGEVWGVGFEDDALQRNMSQYFGKG